MNIQTPINPTKRCHFPHLATDEILRISELPNAVAEAKKIAAARFHGENPDFDYAEAEQKTAPKRLRKLKRELRSAERSKRSLSKVRSWRTGKARTPMSWAQRVKIAVGVAFVLVDVPLLVYTAAQYVLASGAIETLADSIWAALPFAFLPATAVIGLKALVETRGSEEERERFTAGLLWIGAAAVTIFVIFFALSFNPAAVQPAAATGAGLDSLVARAPISWEVASGLVLTQVFATITFGAGISLSVSQAADRNKTLHAEPSANFAEASREVDELAEQCATIEAESVSNAAYIARYKGTRDHFVETQATRVMSMRDYVAAKRRMAHHDIANEIAAAGK